MTTTVIPSISPRGRRFNAHLGRMFNAVADLRQTRLEIAASCIKAVDGGIGSRREVLRLVQGLQTCLPASNARWIFKVIA